MNIMVMGITNEVTMSSREIAELTRKAHHHVKRDIEIMLEQLEEDASKFGGIYLDAQNRRQTEFLLDRYHTEVLVTGYDVKRRAAVIKRWYDLETGLPLTLKTPHKPARGDIQALLITRGLRVGRVVPFGPT